MLLHLLQVAAGIVIVAWQYAGFVLTLRFDYPVVCGVYHELRPLYLPAVAVAAVTAALTDYGPLWSQAFMTALNIVGWWLYKNVGGDDDRWKRRRQKLAEKVEQVGGRLVVAPAEVGAR